MAMQISYEMVSNAHVRQLILCGSYLRVSEKTLESQGFEEIILRGVGLAWYCNKRFLDPEGKKISRRGHLIDDSNKYRFVYVPSTISSEKKNILDVR